ncbi:MAG: hypothetical protein FWD92_05340 [Methanomassiliicoccaceae archaeon]|nr:hypothetical protein [Methanomassiliicoccaceae archaeon]
MAVAAILLTSALLVYVFLSDDNGDKDETFIKDLGDGNYLILSGDFIPNRTMSVDIDADVMTITVNAGATDSYHWIVFDHDRPASTSKTSFIRYTGDIHITYTSALEITDVRYGYFTISVEFENENGNEVRYSGSIVYVGNVVREFSWSVGSNDYDFSISFSYVEYHEFRMKAADRSPRSNDYTAFVQQSPAIKEISENLRSLNGTGNDAELANLILSFVQMCIEYPPAVFFGGGTSFLMSPDMYLTGYDNYAFYPMETIFHGMGDCEDTSILAAVLFESLGFRSALFLVPGHAMVGVSLIDHDPINILPPPFELLFGTKDGIRYYVAETSIDIHIPIGFVDNSFLFGGHNLSHYLNHNQDPRFGLFPVKR